MEVKKFYIEESTQNKGCFILIAETESGDKFVVSGNPHFSTYLEPYKNCYYTPNE